MLTRFILCLPTDVPAIYFCQPNKPHLRWNPCTGNVRIDVLYIQAKLSCDLVNTIQIQLSICSADSQVSIDDQWELRDLFENLETRG